MKALSLLLSLAAVAAAEPIKLTDTNGRSITAEVLKITDGKASVRKADGTSAMIALVDLNAESREAVRMAAAKAAPKDTDSTGIDDKLTSIVGKWKRDYDGAIFEFKDTKSGTWNTKQAFTVSYNADKKRVIITSDRWTNEVAFTPNNDALNGSYELNGKTTRYKLTRIKE